MMTTTSDPRASAPAPQAAHTCSALPALPSNDPTAAPQDGAQHAGLHLRRWSGDALMHDVRVLAWEQAPRPSWPGRWPLDRWRTRALRAPHTIALLVQVDSPRSGHDTARDTAATWGAGGGEGRARTVAFLIGTSDRDAGGERARRDLVDLLTPTGSPWPGTPFTPPSRWVHARLGRLIQRVSYLPTSAATAHATRAAIAASQGFTAGEVAQLSGIYVAPAWRRRGIASSLVRAFEQEALTRGARHGEAFVPWASVGEAFLDECGWRRMPLCPVPGGTFTSAYCTALQTAPQVAGTAMVLPGVSGGRAGGDGLRALRRFTAASGEQRDAS